MEYNYVLGSSNAHLLLDYPQFSEIVDHLLRTDKNNLLTNSKTHLNELFYNNAFYSFSNFDTHSLSKELKHSFLLNRFKFETVYVDYSYFNSISNSLESLLSQIGMPLFNEFMDYTVIIVLHRDENETHFHRIFIDQYEFDYCHVPFLFEQNNLEL